MTDYDLQDWMRLCQQRVEAALARHLPEAHAIPARLHEAMRYAVLGGGKRVRPLLVYAAGALTADPAASADEAKVVDTALDTCACGVELIHVYSLVHDDLPCMDDDTLRRGRPTCHVAYDEATALLVGDSLQTLAFEVLTRAGDAPSSILNRVRLLSQAAGSCGMAGGQAIDLDAVGRSLDLPELELMHSLKTGALIRAAVLLGASCGKPLATADYAALDHYARRIGLLFQIVDDILDCTASTATLGKTAGKDAAADKPTTVSLLGLSEARRFAAELQTEAEASLAPFGLRAAALNGLTRFIAGRDF